MYRYLLESDPRLPGSAPLGCPSHRLSPRSRFRQGYRRDRCARYAGCTSTAFFKSSRLSELLTTDRRYNMDILLRMQMKYRIQPDKRRDDSNFNRKYSYEKCTAAALVQRLKNLHRSPDLEVR
jgi:hypothetical protein